MQTCAPTHDREAVSPTPVRNRVSLVDTSFWIVKLLAATVGEAVAEFMILDLRLGLATTAWVIGGLLTGVLMLQFAQRRYVPWIYWQTVVLISIVGVIAADELVSIYGFSLVTAAIVLGALLAATLSGWYVFEQTLSIRTIHSSRREAFYWLAIALSFALGTIAGELVAESLHAGRLATGLGFALAVEGIAFAYLCLGLGSIVSFWLAYILTGPLGASLGHLFSLAQGDGGLGFGPAATSVLFLAVIIVMVVWMSLHPRDVPRKPG